MSFNLTVVFTGLIGFVENTSGSRARMCALVVDGEPGRPSTFDESLLRRHRAFVAFPIHNVSSLSNRFQDLFARESLGVWYPQRDRIFFEIENDPDTPAGTNDFRVERMRVPDMGHPRRPADAPAEDHDSLTWALDMGKVLPYFRVDPRLLSPRPPENSVVAQVVLDRGTVATRTITRAVWDYDSTLSGRPYVQAFAHEVEVRYRGLAAARLVAESFDPPQRRKFIDLTGLQEGSNLEIHIVNTCDCNPLRWSSNDDPVPDEDTRWNFELVAADLQERIREELAGRPLPIPRPILPIPEIDNDFGAPGSGNCIPPLLPSAAFDFPGVDG